MTDFSKLVVTLKDEGEELVIVRPGISLSLFYEAPVGRIGGAVADILDDFVAFISPASLDMYYAPSAVYKTMTDKAYRSTVQSLRSLEQNDEFFEFHFGPGLEVGSGFAAHFTGSALADESMPDETNLLTLEFPPDFLQSRAPSELFEFCVRSAQRTSFHFGLCGYAFQHSVTVLEGEAKEEIAKLAMRYRGFDISYDDIRYDLRQKIHNVGWLTLLGDRLVRAFGGAEKLRRAMPSGSVLDIHGGVVVVTAEYPVVGDVNRPSSELSSLSRLATLLKPLRIETDYLGSDDDDFAQRWLDRLEV